MKSFLCVLFVFLCVVDAGCCSQKGVVTVPVETQTIVRERVVEVVTAADSSIMTAYLECDSNYNVMLRRFDEQKTSGMATAMSLNNSIVSYRVVRISDTLFVAARDSFIYKEIPVFVEVPVEKRRATKWEQISGWLALISVAALFIMIFLGIYRIFK